MSKQKRKSIKKPLLILLFTFIFFGVFIYFITLEGTVTKAIRQVEICANIDQVKSIFNRYQFEEDFITNNEQTGEREIDPDFLFAIRNKLDKLIKNEQELNECLEWIPQSKTSLNIIIVPDLSKRLLDTINCPKQISNDLRIIDSIWSTFIRLTSMKLDSKDRLIIDVSDKGQAGGSFEHIADKLQIDLSTHNKGQSNRLFFTDKLKSDFHKNVEALYRLTKEGEFLGADFHLYIKRYIKNHLRKSTIFERINNKVIILTDGYLEPQNKKSFTPIYHKSRNRKFNYDYREQLYSAVELGTIPSTINRLGLSIPKINNVDLTDVEFLVCEVIERYEDNGTDKDFDILMYYWTDWLTRQGATFPVENFLKREQSMNVTIGKINKFLEIH